MQVRTIRPTDHAQWEPLWQGYNAFYGRQGESALPGSVSAATWARFFDVNEPVFALVAELDGHLLGFAHFLYHRSTTKIELTCYLQDLFTDPARRGVGVGRALIQGVYEQASLAGIQRVYWHTQETNVAARRLYDKVARHAGFIVYTHDA